MPNWCNNNISISGPTETIKQLWEDANADDTYGLLNAIKPLPEALRDTVKGTGEENQTVWVDGCNNWYDWCVKNWGTKWDVSDEGLEFVDNGDGTAMIEGWFDTAWAPPIEAYNTFCDDMDNCTLSASYHEPGMDFGGFYEDGEDEYMEGISETIAGNEPDLWDDLTRRLDEEYGISEQIEMWDEEEDA